MRPTPPLLRRVRRFQLTTKQGPKDYYKGNRTGTMGRHTKHGGFLVDYRKVRTYMCPPKEDLDECKLTPFVSKRFRPPTYFSYLESRPPYEKENDNELRAELELGNEFSDRSLYKVHREEMITNEHEAFLEGDMYKMSEEERELLRHEGTDMLEEDETIIRNSEARTDGKAAEELQVEEQEPEEIDLLTLPDPRSGEDGRKPNWLWHWSTGQGFLLQWLKANPDRKIISDHK